jgi:hypothetical protein
MKSLIYSALSALLVTTVTAPIAMAVPTTRNQSVQAEASMVFNFTGPMVTNSGVLNSTYFLRIAVIGMSLQDVVVSIPSQMERFSSVRVVDQSGKEVPAKATLSKERLILVFDEPVAPGGYLQVEFNGVQMNASGGDILLYGITARRTGLSGEIPVGTARIQVPIRGN